MPKRTVSGLLVALAVALGGCGGGGSTPSAPSGLQVTGTWSGSITSNQVSGSGPARVTLTQSGTTLTGTWNATGPGGPDSGNLTGSVSGQGVAMTLNSSVPSNCPYTVNVTVSGASMTGTYAAFQCTVAASGGISLTKQ